MKCSECGKQIKNRPRRCAVCGKPVEQVRPCEYYRRRGEVTCDECCERCYRTEPFPCLDHDTRACEDLEG